MASGVFDSSLIKMKRWSEWEKERRLNRQRMINTGYRSPAGPSRQVSPVAVGVSASERKLPQVPIPSPKSSPERSGRNPPKSVPVSPITPNPIQTNMTGFGIASAPVSPMPPARTASSNPYSRGSSSSRRAAEDEFGFPVQESRQNASQLERKSATGRVRKIEKMAASSSRNSNANI
jgi:hypothetical protein